MTAFVSIIDSLHTFGSGSCQTRTTYSLIKSNVVKDCEWQEGVNAI